MALERSRHRLIFGVLREVEWGENEYALILADPPYGIHTEKFGSQATKRHRYKDTKEEALNRACLCVRCITRTPSLRRQNDSLCLNFLQPLAFACAHPSTPHRHQLPPKAGRHRPNSCGDSLCVDMAAGEGSFATVAIDRNQ